MRPRANKNKHAHAVHIVSSTHRVLNKISAARRAGSGHLLLLLRTLMHRTVCAALPLLALAVQPPGQGRKKRKLSPKKDGGCPMHQLTVKRLHGPRNTSRSRARGAAKGIVRAGLLSLKSAHASAAIGRKTIGHSVGGRRQGRRDAAKSVQAERKFTQLQAQAPGLPVEKGFRFVSAPEELLRSTKSLGS